MLRGPVPTAWGPRQGLRFLGLTAATLGALGLAYFFFVLPPARSFDTPQRMLDDLKPNESWMYWQYVRRGVANAPTAEIQQWLQGRHFAWRGITWSAAVFGVGMIVAACTLIRPKTAP